MFAPATNCNCRISPRGDPHLDGIGNVAVVSYQDTKSDTSFPGQIGTMKREPAPRNVTSNTDCLLLTILRFCQSSKRSSRCQKRPTPVREEKDRVRVCRMLLLQRQPSSFPAPRSWDEHLVPISDLGEDGAAVGLCGYGPIRPSCMYVLRVPFPNRNKRTNDE